jgi:aspartate aminotransferase-like enzyme
MLDVGRYRFKRAEELHEFEAIHRLNYRTFVEEIPQHADPGTGRLVDKFHHKNVYFIALRDEQVVGMISAHGEPPFSVATRLSDPSVLTRPGIRPLEVRLLAVDPGERNGIVLGGLLWSFYEHARDNGFTDLFISGVTNRTELYERLGFEALGPAVRSGEADFVPMSVAFPRLQAQLQKLIPLWKRHLRRLATPDDAASEDVRPANEGRAPATEPVCLLPGPVSIAPVVRAAFQQPPIYHRGAEFVAHFEQTRRQLAEMTGSAQVALLNGSGTLGNECVAATLAAEVPSGRHKPRGVILVNGEFGQRLVRQAARFGLEPRVLNWPWGQPWDLDEIAAALDDAVPDDWIWGVHLESSTGVLNDLPGLVHLARCRGVRVCMDCISSLGAVPLDLRDMFLASAATGKSLGAYAGMAIVFADPERLPRTEPNRLPSYLDVAAALATRGPRFTFPSPTLFAVQAALAAYSTPALAQEQYDHYAALGIYARRQLRELGLAPLADEAWAAPVVTTFAPPFEEATETFVARCRSWGFAIGGQSSYLAQRRLVQIATMGAVTREAFASLFQHLGRWLLQQAPLAHQSA